MKDFKVNRAMQIILGILFAAFGLAYVTVSVTHIDVSEWMFGGVLGIAALVRLVFICLPGGSFFGGSARTEIAAGICEALFGVFFVLNSLFYLNIIYPLTAGLFVLMAVLRMLQSARIKKRGVTGWGSFLFVALVLIAAAAGIVVSIYVLPLELQAEMVGAAALIYGVFLVFSAFLRQGSEQTAPADHSVTFPLLAEEYAAEIGSKRKLG